MEDGAVVPRVVCVVKKVVVAAPSHRQKVRVAPGPVVPAVPVNGFHRPEDQPEQDREHVDGVEEGHYFVGQSEGEDVGDVLERVGVYGGHAGGDRVLVVLVHEVEPSVVHAQVEEVEKDVVEEDKDQSLPTHAEGRGLVPGVHLDDLGVKESM